MTFNDFIAWELSSRDCIDVKLVYVDMAGELAAGVMLSQIVFWNLPTRDGAPRLSVERDGHLWLVRSDADWWDEIRLREGAAKRARGVLVERGLIVVERARSSFHDGGVACHLRLDVDGFLAALDAQIAARVPNPFRSNRPNQIRQDRPNLTTLYIEHGIDQKEDNQLPAVADAGARVARPRKRGAHPEETSADFGAVFDAICRVRRVQRVGKAGRWIMSEDIRNGTRSLTSQLVKMRLPWYVDGVVRTRDGTPTVDAALVLDAGRAWYARMAQISGREQREVDAPSVKQLRDWVPQYCGKRGESSAPESLLGEHAARVVESIEADPDVAAERRERAKLDNAWRRIVDRLAHGGDATSRWLERFRVLRIEQPTLIDGSPLVLFVAARAQSDVELARARWAQRFDEAATTAMGQSARVVVVDVEHAAPG